MPYWLTNPDHGTMPVYDAGDVERHKKMGWTLLNVGESPNLPPKAVIGGFVAQAAVPSPDEFKFVASPPPELSDAGLEKAVALVEGREEKRKPGRPRKV
jgi:hypothetical protein